MAYTIYNTDGSVLSQIPDGQVDQVSTSITLIGKNTSGYGQYLNENFVQMLANFANVDTVPPTSPLVGQLWYDTTSKRLKVYDTAFTSVSGAVVQSTQPSNLVSGDLWFDSSANKQLYIFDGSQTRIVGPTYPATAGAMGVTLPTSYPIPVKDTLSSAQSVGFLKNYGTTLGMLSNSAFTISQTDYDNYLSHVPNASSYNNTNPPEKNIILGLTVFGDLKTNGTFYLPKSNPPAHSNSAGTQGQIAWGSDPLRDGQYALFVCIHSGTDGNAQWGRIEMNIDTSW